MAEDKTRVTDRRSPVTSNRNQGHGMDKEAEYHDISLQYLYTLVYALIAQRSNAGRTGLTSDEEAARTAA
jgi:hypothetical protein